MTSSGYEMQLAEKDARTESLRQQLADLLEANRIMCEDFAAENNKCAALEQKLAAAHKERDELALIVATDTGTESAAADLQNQLDNHMKREVMLRDALRHLWNERTPDSYDEAGEALAATADLDGLILCHAEPVATVDEDDDNKWATLADNIDINRGTPLYIAREPSA